MHEEILELSPELEPVYINDDIVIYSFASKWNPGFSTDVTIHDKTVTVRSVQLREGVNKYSGKPWKNWVCLSSVIYSLKQQKYEKPILRVYETKKVQGRRHQLFRNSTAGEVQRLISMAERLQGGQPSSFGKTSHSHYRSPMDVEVQKLVLMNLLLKYRKLAKLEEDYLPTKDNLLAMAYPAASLFPEVGNLHETLPYANAVWCKQNDVRAFLKENYGKKAVRKDVIKALASMTDANSAVVASYFHRYVPIDWLIPLFLEPQKYYITSGIRAVRSSKFTPELKKILALATLPQRKKLLHEPADDDSRYPRFYLDDVTTLLSDMTVEYLIDSKNALRFDSWRSLHDSLSVIHRRKDMVPQPVPQNGVAKYLDGEKVVTENGVYVVRSPKVSTELLDWGNTLKNCIASYSKRVVASTTQVFALYTEGPDKLYANLEYRDGRIIQFVGDCNKSVPYPVEEAFNEVLKVAERKVQKEKQAKKQRKVKALVAA